MNALCHRPAQDALAKPAPGGEGAGGHAGEVDEDGGSPEGDGGRSVDCDNDDKERLEQGEGRKAQHKRPSQGRVSRTTRPRTQRS